MLYGRLPDLWSGAMARLGQAAAWCDDAERGIGKGQVPTRFIIAGRWSHNSPPWRSGTSPLVR